MAGLRLGGLSSGVDTTGLIEQLVALERQPIAKLELRKRVVDHRQNALEDVLSRLKNLKTKAAELRTLVGSTAQTVESSLPTKVSAKLVSGAAPGGYTLSVTALATAEQRTYTFVPQANTHFIEVNGVQIEIRGGADLAEVVSTINASSTSPVYAAAVNGELVLSSRQTGKNNGFTVTNNGQDVIGAQRSLKAGTDADYTLDGKKLASASNVITDALPGVEISLKGTTATGETATILVGPPATEAETIKKKLKDYIEQYNSTVDFVRGKLSEKRVPNATTEADMKKGVLFNDTALSSLLFKLRSSIGESVQGLPAGLDALTDIGVSTGTSTGAYTADNVSGKLVLDEAKLDQALNSDLNGVKELLGAVSGTSGFAQRIESLLDPVTKADGDMDARIDSADAEMKRISERMTLLERRVAEKEKRLILQFTAMEQRLGAFNAQGSWLGAQLATLG